MQFFVKERRRLRVLQVGHSEVLNTVISLSDECYATLHVAVALSKWVANEGLTSGVYCSCLEKTSR